MGKMIYLDNAATTKTAPEVVEAMLPYFTEMYGNPSSIYDFASKSKEGVTKARGQIADALGAKREEIYFTAGGSEADNWALKATFEAYKSKRKSHHHHQDRASCNPSYLRVSGERARSQDHIRGCR